MRELQKIKNKKGLRISWKRDLDTGREKVEKYVLEKEQRWKQEEKASEKKELGIRIERDVDEEREMHG